MDDKIKELGDLQNKYKILEMALSSAKAPTDQLKNMQRLSDAGIKKKIQALENENEAFKHDNEALKHDNKALKDDKEATNNDKEALNDGNKSSAELS